MITININDCVGNTFIAAAMTALNLSSQRQIHIDQMMQHDGCGTIQVDGEWFDYFKSGNVYKFVKSS